MGYRLDGFDFSRQRETEQREEDTEMGKLNIGHGTPIEEIPTATRGITSEDSIAILNMVATQEPDGSWTPTGTATEYDDAGNRMAYTATSYTNSDGDTVELTAEEAAAKAGRVFKRALAAVEPDGFSAKLRVYQRRGDGAWVFDVMLAPAREGKGEPKPTVTKDGTPAKRPGRPKKNVDAVDSDTDD